MSSQTSEAKTGLPDMDDPSHADGAPSGPVPCPTVRPKFDPLEDLEESELRERMPTVTDEAALEQARLQSYPSDPPPPRRPMSTVPGPLVGSSRDSTAEIDVGEDAFDALAPDQQIAILRARLMPLSRVPYLAKQLREIGAAIEDARTAYVVGFVDGILPLDTIVDVTGLPELDTLRVLDRLATQGIVIFRAGFARD